MTKEDILSAFVLAIPVLPPVNPQTLLLLSLLHSVAAIAANIRGDNKEEWENISNTVKKAAELPSISLTSPR